MHGLYINKNGIFEEAPDHYIINRALDLTKPRSGEFINSKDSLVKHLRIKLGNATHETFGVIYCDNQFQFLFSEEFPGEISSVVLQPRRVVEGALKNAASTVFVYHNHPSGIKKPSLSDIKFTLTLRDALALIDVKLMDHVIITASDHHSMKECGDI